MDARGFAGLSTVVSHPTRRARPIDPSSSRYPPLFPRTRSTPDLDAVPLAPASVPSAPPAPPAAEASRLHVAKPHHLHRRSQSHNTLSALRARPAFSASTDVLLARPAPPAPSALASASPAPQPACFVPPPADALDAYAHVLMQQWVPWCASQQHGPSGRLRLASDEDSDVGLLPPVDDGQEHASLEIRHAAHRALLARLSAPHRPSAIEPPPPLERVPELFFDRAFDLSRSSTFHTLFPGEADEGPISSAALRREQLVYYASVLDRHLQIAVGDRAQDFFAALGQARALQSAAAEGARRVAALQRALVQVAGADGAPSLGAQLVVRQSRRRLLQGAMDRLVATRRLTQAVENIFLLATEPEPSQVLEAIERFTAAVYARLQGEASHSSGAGELDYTTLCAVPAKNVRAAAESVAALYPRLVATLERKLMNVLRADLIVRVTKDEAWWAPSRQTSLAPVASDPAPSTPTQELELGWGHTSTSTADANEARARRTRRHRSLNRSLSIAAEQLRVNGEQSLFSPDEERDLPEPDPELGQNQGQDQDEDQDEGAEVRARLRAFVEDELSHPPEAENPPLDDPDGTRALGAQLHPLLKGLVQLGGVERALQSYEVVLLDALRTITRRRLRGVPGSLSPWVCLPGAPTGGEESLPALDPPETSIIWSNATPTDTFLPLLQGYLEGLMAWLAGIRTQSRTVLLVLNALAQMQIGDIRPPPLDERVGLALGLDPGTALARPRGVGPSLPFVLTGLIRTATSRSHTCLSRLLALRGQAHRNLPLSDFVQVFRLTWAFVLRSEWVARVVLPSVRRTMASQARAFLHTFHARAMSACAKAVEEERWDACAVPASTQQSVDALLSGQAEAHFADLPPQAEGESKTLALSDGHAYLVGASVEMLSLLGEYLRFILSLPHLAPEGMARLLSFLKTFNSRTCQVVLGAGAMRSAGLKNITAKHLALASQSLEVVLTLLPSLEAVCTPHLNVRGVVPGVPAPPSTVMTPIAVQHEWGKVRADFTEHQREVHAKLVSIMGDRIGVHMLPLAAGSARGEGVRSYMVDLCRETTLLSKVLWRYLPAPTVKMIMQEVYRLIDVRLTSTLKSIYADTISPEAQNQMEAEITYLTERMRQLKGDPFVPQDLAAWWDERKALTCATTEAHAQAAAQAHVEDPAQGDAQAQPETPMQAEAQNKTEVLSNVEAHVQSNTQTEVAEERSDVENQPQVPAQVAVEPPTQTEVQAEAQQDPATRAAMLISNQSPPAAAHEHMLAYQTRMKSPPRAGGTPTPQAMSPPLPQGTRLGHAVEAPLRNWFGEVQSGWSLITSTVSSGVGHAHSSVSEVKDKEDVGSEHVEKETPVEVSAPAPTSTPVLAPTPEKELSKVGTEAASDQKQETAGPTRDLPQARESANVMPSTSDRQSQETAGLHDAPARLAQQAMLTRDPTTESSADTATSSVIAADPPSVKDKKPRMSLAQRLAEAAKKRAARRPLTPTEETREEPEPRAGGFQNDLSATNTSKQAAPAEVMAAETGREEAKKDDQLVSETGETPSAVLKDVKANGVKVGSQFKDLDTSLAKSEQPSADQAAYERPKTDEKIADKEVASGEAETNGLMPRPGMLGNEAAPHKIAVDAPEVEVNQSKSKSVESDEPREVDECAVDVVKPNEAESNTAKSVEAKSDEAESDERKSDEPKPSSEKPGRTEADEFTSTREEANAFEGHDEAGRAEWRSVLENACPNPEEDAVSGPKEDAIANPEEEDACYAKKDAIAESEEDAVSDPKECAVGRLVEDADANLDDAAPGEAESGKEAENFVSACEARAQSNNCDPKDVAAEMNAATDHISPLGTPDTLVTTTYETKIATSCLPETTGEEDTTATDAVQEATKTPTSMVNAPALGVREQENAADGKSENHPVRESVNCGVAAPSTEDGGADDTQTSFPEDGLLEPAEPEATAEEKSAVGSINDTRHEVERQPSVSASDGTGMESKPKSVAADGPVPDNLPAPTPRLTPVQSDDVDA